MSAVLVSDVDLAFLLYDEHVERDPETGLAWTEEDELAATSMADLHSVPVDGPQGSAGILPDLSEVWAGVSRVPPRPLPGVTGVTGAGLAATLAGFDPALLSPAQLVEMMTGCERLIRWTQGVQLDAIKALADYAVITDEDSQDHPLVRRSGPPQVVETGFGTQREIERFCSDGIGAALGTSFSAGQRLIDTAFFAADVPVARRLLAEGRLDTARLGVLARELAPVGYAHPDDRQFVDDSVAEFAGLTPKQLEVRVREAVIARSPDDAREVHRRAASSRGVWVSKRPGGMAGVHLRLRAEEAQLAYQALNAAAWSLHDTALAGSGARCEAGEYRSFDQFRADAFMAQMLDLQLAHLRGPVTAEPAAHEPVVAGPRSRRAARMMDPARVMLHLYMTASTLVGQSDRPAVLLGYGPIGADRARALAEDATVVRLLTDPFTGEVRAVDLPAYRVPKILRWAVQARDRTCVFPACDTPAYDTQLDHVRPHPFARKLGQAFATGTTSYANLQQLCTRHHLLKTHGGWTIQSTNGSRLEWVSPTGHSYRRNPEWGPPAGFWDDHDRARPIDGPPPDGTEPAGPDDPGICPF